MIINIMKQPLDKTIPTDIFGREEESDCISGKRKLKEIEAAAFELHEKVWYNRHQCRKDRMKEKGNGTSGLTEDQIAINATAEANAQRIRAEYGAENLEWSDFEWGLLQGRLSALNWVKGRSRARSLDT